MFICTKNLNFSFNVIQLFNNITQNPHHVLHHLLLSIPTHRPQCHTNCISSVTDNIKTHTTNATIIRALIMYTKSWWHWRHHIISILDVSNYWQWYHITSNTATCYYCIIMY